MKSVRSFCFVDWKLVECLSDARVDWYPSCFTWEIDGCWIAKLGTETDSKMQAFWTMQALYGRLFRVAPRADSMCDSVYSCVVLLRTRQYCTEIHCSQLRIQIPLHGLVTNSTFIWSLTGRKMLYSKIVERLSSTSNQRLN